MVHARKPREWGNGGMGENSVQPLCKGEPEQRPSGWGQPGTPAAGGQEFQQAQCSAGQGTGRLECGGEGQW